MVYGNEIVVPNSFIRNLDPQYNYEYYYFELKRQMQEAQKMARTTLLDSKHKSKQRYDRAVTPLKINIGDKVLMQEKASNGELAPSLKWLGPYTVVEACSGSPNLIINKRNKPKTVHRNLLKLVHENQ